MGLLQIGGSARAKCAGRVVGIDLGPQRSDERDAQDLGDLQPHLPRGEDRGDVGRPEAERERARRPAAAGVGVGTDHHLAGADHPTLHHELVGDALPLVDGDPVFLGEIAGDGLVLRLARASRRVVVVEDEDAAVGALEALDPVPLEGPSHHGPRSVVRHDPIGGHRDQIPRRDRSAHDLREKMKNKGHATPQAARAGSRGGAPPPAPRAP